MNTSSISILRTQAKRLNLFRPVGFDDVSDEVLASRYNGCGPDWLPAKFRRELTSKFHRFEAAFLIHDDMFTDSDGTGIGFTVANDWLYENCRKIVRDEVHWIRFWKRIELDAACIEIWSACNTLGFPGWIANSKRRIK